MTIADIGSNRLKDVLVRDKNHSPNRLKSVLQSEITSLLQNYVELDDEVVLKIDEERGRISIEIKATAVRIKEFGTFL